ncbi:uncharacterized protein LOC133845976 [Drosophila sulfurigaster albostrigata]|uniref:uncharacterized protein LOC133845976 n=1 Tax=Drosophila sulfurigaster albostrigata TaxID=89887 RepID=UPI002D21E259|nr:uncharacterized protein LOC133845976 [Drosophila sulfurigaster albostrigata]
MFCLEIAALLCISNLALTEASSLLIQSGESKFSPKYFQNFTIDIINNTLNLEMTTIKPFTRGFKVHLDFSISLGKTKHYQSVFSHIIDTCGVVSAVKNNIFKSWFQSMLEHGNFMYNCPVVVGQYFLRNWKLDGELVPHYLYAGDYRVKGHFFFGKLKSKHEDFVLDLTIFALLKTN